VWMLISPWLTWGCPRKRVNLHSTQDLTCTLCKMAPFPFEPAHPCHALLCTEGTKRQQGTAPCAGLTLHRSAGISSTYLIVTNLTFHLACIDCLPVPFSMAKTNTPMPSLARDWHRNLFAPYTNFAALHNGRGLESPARSGDRKPL
jgi:hypothetical protein